VNTAVDAGVHVVIGSSGLSAEDYTDLDRRARNAGVGVFAAGKFLRHGRDPATCGRDRRAAR
jgi:4-hydroxy-tetrahydrodipicolinate reductase